MEVNQAMVVKSQAAVTFRAASWKRVQRCEVEHVTCGGGRYVTRVIKCSKLPDKRKGMRLS